MYAEGIEIQEGAPGARRLAIRRSCSVTDGDRPLLTRTTGRAHGAPNNLLRNAIEEAVVRLGDPYANSVNVDHDEEWQEPPDAFDWQRDDNYDPHDHPEPDEGWNFVAFW